MFKVLFTAIFIITLSFLPSALCISEEATENNAFNATALDMAAAAAASNNNDTGNTSATIEPLPLSEETPSSPTSPPLENTGYAIASYEERPVNISSSVIDLACTNAYLSPFFQPAYVGVGPMFYNKGFSCGRCILIQCNNDSTCAETNSKVIATIVDLCGECVDGDLTIFGALFSRLAGRDAHPNPRLAISWQFTDCSPFINSSIKMLVKPNGSPYYQAFNFANSRQPITAVQVNGQRLKHENNNYWSWNPTGGSINPWSGPFTFALLGDNGQVLKFRIASLKSQDTKVQFAAPMNATTSSSSTASMQLSSAADSGTAPSSEDALSISNPSLTVVKESNNNNASG